MSLWIDPWAEMRRMQREMTCLFDNSLALEQGSERRDGSGQVGTRSQSGSGLWRPVIDVSENEKSIVVHAELPGLSKENVSIDIEDNRLTLSGERKYEKKEENEKYHRVERSFGKFSRSVLLPEGVDPSKVSASFNNGVLEITVPKPEQAQPKKIQVNIN